MNVLLLTGDSHMAEWIPFWTEEVKIENGGRYPLLLNRFHDHLEDYLIKGIVSITDRLRYISYCCWIIGDIEQTLQVKNFSQFKEAFCRRESALAVGTYLLQPETELGNYVIYGRDYMRGRYEDVNKKHDMSFSVLPSNALGAYGQYYKGTLQNWGLTYIDDNEIIRLTDTGNELFQIVNSYYSNCSYFMHYKGKQYVPGNVLIEWSEINHFDNIRDKSHVEERNFYKKTLFHLEQKIVDDYRRDSLTLYLECICEAEKNGLIFDERFISNAFYYKKYSTVNELRIFRPSSFLDEVSFHWMIYEMHVHFQWWISRFFQDFLYKLKGSYSGLSIDEVIGLIDSSIFNNQVKKILHTNIDYYTNKYEVMRKKIKKFSETTDQLLEDSIAYDETYNMSENCANMLMVLSLIYDKYSSINDDGRFINIRVRLSEDFWFKDIFQIMNSLEGMNIPEVLKIILHRFVIQKHDVAMFEKRDLRRCWFTRSGEKYIYHADANIEWRSAKHDKICNFLFDMKLIDKSEYSFVVSNEGKKLYKELINNYYEE
jgi:hypothetical protein